MLSASDTVISDSSNLKTWYSFGLWYKSRVFFLRKLRPDVLWYGHKSVQILIGTQGILLTCLGKVYHKYNWGSIKKWQIYDPWKVAPSYIPMCLVLEFKDYACEQWKSWKITTKKPKSPTFPTPLLTTIPFHGMMIYFQKVYYITLNSTEPQLAS